MGILCMGNLVPSESQPFMVLPRTPSWAPFSFYTSAPHIHSLTQPCLLLSTGLTTNCCPLAYSYRYCHSCPFFYPRLEYCSSLLSWPLNYAAYIASYALQPTLLAAYHNSTNCVQDILAPLKQ